MEGMPYLAVLVSITLILYFVYVPIAVVALVLTAFTAFFFRNPNRVSPEGAKLVLSPADGKVMSVSEVEEPDLIKGKAWKVTIFLSIFNVHINRSPVYGKVMYIKYKEGKFLPAFKSHASDLNERNTVGIESSHGRLVVRQITGFIARRIVCRVNTGDTLNAGERFGMIKFGSCTEVYVPISFCVKAKAGEKVKGGVSIIGTI